MRKHFLKLFVFIIISFCFVPMYVKANEGDLRYEITDVNISSSKITFKGWAFIHRTNNYVTVENTNGEVIKKDGDQKILIRAVLQDGSTITKVVNGGTAVDYNFYCELFHSYKKNESENYYCDKNHYENVSSDIINTCKNDSYGNTAIENSVSSQCYYEDLYFEISFDVSTLGYGEVKFYIAASNADFENKTIKNYVEYSNDKYTELEPIYISSALKKNNYPDNIIVEASSFTDTVDFIASSGWLESIDRTKSGWELLYQKNGKYVFGAWHQSADKISGNCESTKYKIYTGYNTYGIPGKITNNGCDGNNFLGENCKGSGYWVINIGEFVPFDDYNMIGCPTTGVAGEISEKAVASASFVRLSGDSTFLITIKERNLCDVTTPSSGPLECNESKTFNSKCDKLTVVTSEGNADVTIEQTGHISSVLTPSSTYAGGGFNFVIMYYNTIKWYYASGFSRPSYHNLVVEQMNNKLKEYENYINNINISELMFNNELANINMVKKCSTNKNNKNYYKDELVTMCVFSFPLAEVALNGNVTYKSDSTSFNVSNKYYTPINFNGSYNITAKISGMDRIKENDAKNDSKDRSKAWTGDWNDNFTNCKINLYTLIAGIPKFIYRPIDINNPFPNRNAGVNWYDWWSINNNKKRLKETYSDLDYTVVLDNKTIADIKKYNESHNYLEWDSIDDNTKESSFIRENSSYISKVGDD